MKKFAHVLLISFAFFGALVLAAVAAWGALALFITYPMAGVGVVIFLGIFVTVYIDYDVLK
jgi:hypothetical protein